MGARDYAELFWVNSHQQNCNFAVQFLHTPGTELEMPRNADLFDESVSRYEPTMDKIMRLHNVSSTIENGFVHLP
jgi:hypothetical protein